MDIIRRLPEINELEELKSRVRVLERITQELSKTINELKKLNRNQLIISRGFTPPAFFV